MVTCVRAIVVRVIEAGAEVVEVSLAESEERVKLLVLCLVCSQHGIIEA